MSNAISDSLTAGYLAPMTSGRELHHSRTILHSQEKS
jgi:hypothetical protein